MRQPLDPARALTGALTAEDGGQGQQLRAAFAAYDVDGNGAIDLQELKQVMRSLGADEGPNVGGALGAEVGDPVTAWHATTQLTAS